MQTNQIEDYLRSNVQLNKRGWSKPHYIQLFHLIVRTDGKNDEQHVDFIVKTYIEEFTKYTYDENGNLVEKENPPYEKIKKLCDYWDDFSSRTYYEVALMDEKCSFCFKDIGEKDPHEIYVNCEQTNWCCDCFNESGFINIDGLDEARETIRQYEEEEKDELCNRK